MPKNGVDIFCTNGIKENMIFRMMVKLAAEQNMLMSFLNLPVDFSLKCNDPLVAAAYMYNTITDLFM